MVPKITYELRISFPTKDRETEALKENIMAWLSNNGYESFVEGVLDCLDLDPDYDETGVDMYAEAGGTLAPLSVFEYEEELLLDLEKKINEAFDNKLEIEQLSQETSTWMEGWKDSFKPLETNNFVIHPPWDKPKELGNKQAIEIEPGMAFGTGQHATTTLCLNQIEKMASTMENKEKMSFLDIGTGSGILAIAAKKLGFGEVKGTDIEAAAVHATKENSKANGVDVDVWKGSVPVPPDNRDAFHKPFDIIVANILIMVLERIIFDISEIAESGTILILSGFLVEQEEKMQSLAEEAGFAIVDRSSLKDWSCFELEKL